MNVALVLAPSYNPDKPPLSLAYLKSYNQREGVNIKCFDLNIDLYSNVDAENKKLWEGENMSCWLSEDKVEKIDFIDDALIEEWLRRILSFDPMIAGFTTYNTNILLTLKIAKRLRERNSKVFILFGGPEIFSYRYNFEMVHLRFIDAIILGEGEEMLRKIIKSIHEKGFIAPIEGVLVKIGDCFAGDGKPGLISNLDSIPLPDYDDFDISKYKEPGQLPLIFSRGCVNRCAFCFETVFWQKFRVRTVANIIKEIEHILMKYNRRIFNFSMNDSLINGDFRLLDEFCSTVIDRKMGIGWWGMARIDKRMNIRLLKKLVRAGCVSLAYGIESGSQKVLDLMQKHYALQEIEHCIKDTFKAGIKIGISVIVGFPGEEEKDFMETCELVKRIASYVSYVNISSLGIIPFTKISEERYKLGIVENDSLNWSILDKKNTLSIRVDRVNRLAEVAHKYVGKTYTFDQKD